MNVILKYGGLLGGLVVLWMFVMGFTGWYRDPVLLNLFWLVIPLQAWILALALRRTAKAGAAYGTQIGIGLAVSSVAGLVIVLGSLLFTMVAFPNYFEDLREVQARLMREAGIPEAAILGAMDTAKETYTPLRHALEGFVMTVVTGILLSAIAAIWIRHRSDRVAA